MHRSICCANDCSIMWGPQPGSGTAAASRAPAVSNKLLHFQHLLPVRTAASRPKLSTDACDPFLGCSAPSVNVFKTADLDPAGDTGSFASSMLAGQQGLVGFSKDQFVEAGLGFVNPCSTTLSGGNDSCISGASLLPLRSE